MSPIPVKPVRPPTPDGSPTPGERAPSSGESAKADAIAANFRLRMMVAENLGKIKHKIIVMSGKGGVGKSTVAVNLAAAFAKAGAKVGIMDVDLTNPNVPHMLGLGDAKPKGRGDGRIEPVSRGENLRVMSTEFFLQNRDTPIIWRGPIKMNMIKQILGNVEWGELDYLFVDLPPGTGDEPLSIAQMLKDADGVILVTTPQGVSIADVKKSLLFCQHLGLTVIGVVENMGAFVCPHCNEATPIFPGKGADEIKEKFGVPILARIPLEPGVVHASEKGEPFVWSDDKSVTSEAFATLVANVKAHVERDDA